MDSALVLGMNSASSGMVSMMVGPVAAACLLALGIRGVKVATGDGAAMNGFWFAIVKIMLVVGLATNIGNFNSNVSSLIFTSLPNTLATAVGGTASSLISGTASVGAIFDKYLATAQDRVGQVWGEAGILDVGSRIGAIACDFFIVAALILMALIYELAHILLAIVIVFGPIAIALTLFPQTANVFARWMGKCISLVFLIVAAVILLQILFTGNDYFISQMVAMPTTATSGWLSVGGPAPTTAPDLVNLVALAVWFTMGAVALVFLPAIAYSIGGGVALSVAPVLGVLMAAADAVQAGIGALDGISLASGGSTAMSLADTALADDSFSYTMPPEPPPSLSFSSNPVIGP